jgi:exosortase family protein XrtM
MNIRYSSIGVPYLPDGGDHIEAEPPRKPKSPIRHAIVFFVVFVTLQTLWTAAADTIVERLIIDKATVEVASVWLRLLTPSIPVTAVGTRLTAPEGGINVLRGCEGTEVLFLLAAAFAVAPLGWRQRLGGLALGTMVVYLLNQIRVVALFYAYRYDRILFAQLHGTLAPLVMIALVGLYFFAWMHLAAHRHESTAS